MSTEPSQLSDYDHYTFHEHHHDKNPDGVPVYQSRSNGMLFAEDATPLIYYEGTLLDAVGVCRALIEIQGSDDRGEESLHEMIGLKEQFSRLLEAELLS